MDISSDLKPHLTFWLSWSVVLDYFQFRIGLLSYSYPQVVASSGSSFQSSSGDDIQKEAQGLRHVSWSADDLAVSFFLLNAKCQSLIFCPRQEMLCLIYWDPQDISSAIYYLFRPWGILSNVFAYVICLHGIHDCNALKPARLLQAREGELPLQEN